MSDTEESKPKRQKRESSYKAKAFEKFKQLKSGKNKYEIEEVDNVYETVDERAYTKEVLSRQDDDWIVDDDGSGYVEDGRDIFDDDLDKESIAAAMNGKGKGVKRKKKAVSDGAGKGKLHHLISNMPVKKKEEKKLEEDETLSELLGEIDDSPINSALKPKPISATLSYNAKKAERDYMRSFSLSSRKSATEAKTTDTRAALLKSNTQKEATVVSKETAVVPKETAVVSKVAFSFPKEETVVSRATVFKKQKDETVDSKGAVTVSRQKPIEDSVTASQIVEEIESQISAAEEEDLDSTVIENNITQDCFDDDFDLDMTQISEAESQVEKNAELEWKQLEEEMLKDWEVNDETEVADFDTTELGGDKNVFRFFWWDAYEDSAKQPGVVFLFGKTYSKEEKSFVSCCVVVKDVERKIYFLPRTTDKQGNAITMQDVYVEINEKIMKPRHVKHFKARPISKKYAFDPAIPTESDYMEVRYSAKDASISNTTEGNSFSKIFGTEASYLEILLLDRKIKGPCWLDVANVTPVSNPMTWCKMEMNCIKASDINITKSEKTLPPPPLTVSTINMRRAINPKNYENEIVMLSCVTNKNYAVDKQAPSVPFQDHFCVITSPPQQTLPYDLHASLNNYKVTKVFKMDNERALLNLFINKFSKLDSDLIVGHDMQGYQINILSERLVKHQIQSFSKLGRLKRSILIKQKLERELFTGRLVCDIKISAKELIKCRSYDLDTICQNVLKLKEGQRIDLEPEDVPKMFHTSQDILKLILLTMQDTSYILKIMYSLNIIPLSLQITNIAGNVMSKTLMGGRSERNEFLLLHAFVEKGYIVPDKKPRKKAEGKTSKNAATYSGGLVLEPKVGFYDKYILLMDFNSLYPSIIQEYNICFTTLPVGLDDENMVLPDKSLPAGILPTEIRKLVESRREVKKLMISPDISNDLRIQYHIRQMALKLTANSMYGCLGFANSRFYARNLAALTTHKGREILTNTRDLVQKQNFEVIYGDTDSIMINTNIVDYDQVFKIGNKLKQEINKLYKQVELDIDGVFKYLLLLKKKKYAAVTLSKTKTGELICATEYKGLDIVRRDWSQLSSQAGKFILQQIFTDQSSDDRIGNIHAHLVKLKEDLEANQVPLSLLVITKQLNKDPGQYTDKNQSQPHVHVALRYNKECGGHLRAGDTVPYIICEDGTSNSAPQRAYHVEELKNSDKLKIDVNYYLANQIHPVISRICEPIEGLDAFQLADVLGLDTASFKKPKQQSEAFTGENITKAEFKFRDVDPFVFACSHCKHANSINGPMENNIPVLEKCKNDACTARPVDYLPQIKNQLIRSVNSYIDKYYAYDLMCEDPMCTNEITRLPVHFVGRYPLCTLCKNAVMLKKYSEFNLYSQLLYFQHIFDLNKLSKKPLLEHQVERAFHELKAAIEKRLQFSAYSVVNLSEMFSGFLKAKSNLSETLPIALHVQDEEDDDEDDV